MNRIHEIDEDGFREEYEQHILESHIASSVDLVQEIVMGVLTDDKKVIENDKLAEFIKSSLDNWVPLNWINWEILYEIFWKPYYKDFQYEKVKENLLKEAFISWYREALYYSKLYKTKEDVIDIILKIINNDESLDYKDSLVSFIKQSLDNWVLISKLTWDELEEALYIKIPWIKIISAMSIGNIKTELLDWLNYVEWDYMILGKDWNLFFCDVSKCNKSTIWNDNENSIRIYMEATKKNYEKADKEMKRIMEQWIISHLQFKYN